MSNWKGKKIVIVGRMDCERIMHVKMIISDIQNKIKDIPEFEFKLDFETQFNIYKDELLKEDLGFLKYTQSPIIYMISEKEEKKTIIGSLEEFERYCIENFNYHYYLSEKDFKEETKNMIKELMITNGNKYVYFDFAIENSNEKLDRVIIELFNNKCPKTVKNFYELAIGNSVNEKGEKLSYKNTIINRISPNSFIQGGDIKVSSGGKSIYGSNFEDEHYDIKHNYHGIVGMVKKNMFAHTNECQFYITLAPLKCFDEKFVAFGRVIKGYDTINKIGQVATDLQRPINKITVTDCGEYSVDLIQI